MSEHRDDPSGAVGVSPERILAEWRNSLEVEQARIEGEVWRSGYRWGFFFGVLSVLLIGSFLI